MSSNTTDDASVPEMGFIERSINYPETMFDAVRFMLQYMKENGYQHYIREELVDRVLTQLAWAESQKQSQVPFLIFWWLYTTLDDYVEMTHDVEKIANPLASSASELAAVRLFALNQMKLFRSMPFMPCNVNQLIKRLQNTFLLGAHHRVPVVLLSNPLDPTRVDKEEHTPPLLLLPSQADQEFAVRMRKTVAHYVRETDWDRVENFAGGVIYAPAADDCGADRIV